MRGHGGGHVGGFQEELPKRPMARKTLARVARLYRPYRKSLIVVAAIIMTSAVFQIATPLLIREVIEQLGILARFIEVAGKRGKCSHQS